MKKQVAAWSDKTKVDVQADFIPSIGNKNVLTMAAEAQANAGHDALAFTTWNVLNYADKLEPIDDVMKRLTDAAGRPTTFANIWPRPKATGWRSRPVRAPR